MEFIANFWWVWIIILVVLGGFHAYACFYHDNSWWELFPHRADHIGVCLEIVIAMATVASAVLLTISIIINILDYAVQ